MYYVAHGHDAISSVQFTLFNPTGTFGSISTSIPSVNTYIFKWVDGTGGGQAAPDSIIQNGELDMVAQGVYSFGSADTSGVIFKTFMMDSNGVSGIPIYLDTNAWYYVCVDVEGGNVFLGMDGGLTDELPRVFGRYNATGYLEYMNWFWSGDVGSGLSNPLPASPTANEGVLPYPETAYLNSVDSFNYSAEKGLVPAIAMIITDNPDTSNVHVAVNQVNKSFADINLYPNPATDHINVAVSLSQMAPTVKYTIIDGLAHVVSRQYHYNVTNDNFDISTSDLASGTYFFIMNANGKVLSRKFTVIK